MISWFNFQQVFQIHEDECGIHEPKFNLSPPHYDGVQAIVVYDDFLISGSRDMSIRKWDLNSKNIECVSVTKEF